MAMRSLKDSTESLAEQLMPGWKAVKTHSGAPDDSEPRTDNITGGTGADSTMPSLADLKAKYVGAGAGPERDSAASMSNHDPSSAADTELVRMQNGPLRKTVAVSKSARKVLWSQG